MNRKEIAILIFIVIAQFMCTSLWFAGNAVLPQLAVNLSISSAEMGWMTSSVQFGFIIGTLFYAFFTIADRFNASTVFLLSALLGAVANGLITFQYSYFGILVFRFLTGFFLAGIYPVGMKIASDHFEKGLGRAMSFLVGALVLGTALPHLLAAFDQTLDWKIVFYVTSGLATLGGLIIKLFVGEGPFQKKVQSPNFGDIALVFKKKPFRAAAFGYFGHMWELYAFWAFVPIMIKTQGQLSSYPETGISMRSFAVIGLGSIACAFGGFLSERFGTKKMATRFLLFSGICCLFSPFAFGFPRPLFLAYMIFWGLTVIADSPLFSTLVAQHANQEIKGTAITIVTSIGFAITIVSIQLLSFMKQLLPPDKIYLLLVVGPLFGLLALRK